MTGSFVFLAGVLYDYPRRFLFLAMLGCIFLSTPMIAVGNIARMDSMLCGRCNKPVVVSTPLRLYSLGVRIALPAIHPNGVYFCFGGFGYFFATRRSMAPLLRKDGLLAIIIALSMWTIYVLYIATGGGIRR